MISLNDINAQILQYLSGRTGGEQLIACIDDAVSNGDVHEYQSDAQRVILQFQDILALYVEDPTKRSEHDSFYGPKRLKSVVLDLQRSIRAIESDTLEPDSELSQG